MTTLVIAWRNLWRNSRRTGLALLAIGLSVTLVLAYTGFLRASADWLLEAITGPLLGHVQAHAPLWRKDRSMNRTLPHAARTVEALRRHPGVAGASARLYAPALAALSEEGFAVVVIGVDVEAESRPARLLTGVPELPGRHRVLMGRALAESMGVRAGDRLALVGQGADGSLANELVTVAALIVTPVDFVNRQGVLMALDEAQELFAMPDEAHEIVAHAKDPKDVKAFAKSLAALSELEGAEVLDWQTQAPEMLSLVKLTQSAGLLILVLVFVAAAAGVANTMLMATFERTRELGMLLALGTRPARIVLVILAESAALGLVGAVAGAALGLGLVAITHHTGIDYAALTGRGPSEISFAGLRWSLRLYPTLAAIDVARAVLGVLLTSLVASVWPATRAAHLQPARALRE